MGNNQSESKTDLVTQIDREYERVRVDARGIILLQKNTQNSYILREYTFGNESMFKNKERELRMQIDKGPHEYIISPLKVQSKSFSSLCSTSYKIYAIFEYPEVTLSQEIRARQKESKAFEEAQLWSVLQSCANALSELKAMVSLNPHQIFINPDGHLKIIHDDLIDENYRAVLNENIFYAPEKIKNFNKLDTDLSLKKEGIFSMGLTLLEAARLDDVSACYDLTQGIFKQTVMIEMLEMLRSKYSDDFIQILGNILEPNPNRRSSLMEVQRALEQYWNNQNTIEQLEEDTPIEEEEEEGRQSSTTHQHPTVLRQRCVNLEQPLNRQSKRKYETSQSKRDTLVPQKLQSFKIEKPQAPQNDMLNPFTPKNPIVIGDSSLYTDPKLLMMIKQDLQDIHKLKHSAFYQTSKYTYMYPNTQSILNSIRNLEKDTETERKIEEFQQHGSQVIKEEQKQYSQRRVEELRPSLVEMKKKNNHELVFTIETYQNGRRYEGTTLAGKKHGKGKLLFEDGAYYQGEFKDDKMDGKGILYYQPNCPAYNGEWYNDQFHGYGTLFNEKAQELSEEYDYEDMNEVEDFWCRYEGDFVFDNKEGKGKLYLTNGECFEGMFNEDSINGSGRFITMHDEVIEGIWQSNILVEIVSSQ